MRKNTKVDLDKSLSARLGNNLNVEIEGLGISLNPLLIGLAWGEYIVLKLVQIDNKTKEQLKNNKIIVTYPHKGAFMKFHSNLISLISDPKDVAFIEYPRVIENYDRRTHQRIECFLPARFAIDNNLIDGPVINISNKGCCCKVKDGKFENKITSDKVTIFLKCRENDDTLSFLGEVTSIRCIKNETTIGVIFDKMDSNLQDVMHNLIPELSFNIKNAI